MGKKWYYYNYNKQPWWQARVAYKLQTGLFRNPYNRLVSISGIPRSDFQRFPIDVSANYAATRIQSFLRGRKVRKNKFKKGNLDFSFLLNKGPFVKKPMVEYPSEMLNRVEKNLYIIGKNYKKYTEEEAKKILEDLLIASAVGFGGVVLTEAVGDALVGESVETAGDVTTEDVVGSVRARTDTPSFNEQMYKEEDVQNIKRARVDRISKFNKISTWHFR
nr:hypothetical protein [Cressdnaviricota sp.]UOF81298.1 hypothetical protein [Cressdnaviricota sp.]